MPERRPHPLWRWRTRLVLVSLSAAAGLSIPLAMLRAGDWEVGICPFRTLTGIPCPFCGATRACISLARFDADFWQYNVVWPPVLLMTLLWLTARLVGLSSGALERWALRRPVPIICVALLAGWVAALANWGTISG